MAETNSIAKRGSWWGRWDLHLDLNCDFSAIESQLKDIALIVSL